MRRQRPACTIPGCGKPHRAHGYCDMHAKRVERRGEPEPPRIRAPFGTRTPCVLDGCDRPRSHADGWCAMHGHRVDRYGQPGPVEPTHKKWWIEPKTCLIDGCDRRARRRGRCEMHGQRLAVGSPNADVPGLLRVVSYNGAKCVVEDCGEPARSRGRCKRHYRKWRYSDPVVRARAKQQMADYYRRTRPRRFGSVRQTA